MDLVDGGDVGALKKKIKSLMEDRILRLKMGKNSRALFVKEFTLEKVVRQTFELYDKVLKQQVFINSSILAKTNHEKFLPAAPNPTPSRKSVSKQLLPVYDNQWFIIHFPF